MQRRTFTFADIIRDCKIETGCHQLDGMALGIKIHVPAELYTHYPYNASAYTFLQQLRAEILDYGIVEFPHLPVNKSNYTLAQRAPREHYYSSNAYLTDICQQPHQDTPPYPTAFWLHAPRRFFATWVMSLQGLQSFSHYYHSNPASPIEDLHRVAVPESLKQKTGILLNETPGLLLIDNSNHRKLFHARTCKFEAVAANPDYTGDTPMFAFNEIGLLNYIESLDSRRGNDNRDAQEMEWIKSFMATEKW